MCGIRYVSLLVIAVGLFSACKDDPTRTKMTYMPDMMDAPTVKPQQEYLDPPEGSVALTAILYPESAEESGELLRNPFVKRPGEDGHRSNGKKLYETFCVVCHGPGAKGNGTITDKYPKPPDLTTAMYRDKKDGYIFHRITFGSLSKIMPGYGYAISPHERWEIILYLRTLQQAH